MGSITSTEFIAGLAMLARDLQSPRDRTVLLQQMGAIMVDEGIRNIMEGHTPAGVPFAPLAHARPIGGGGPLDATGALANSLRAKVSGNGVGVTSNHPGARLHMNGGVVQATNAQFLTIPLTAVAYGRRARTIGFKLHARFRKGAERGALYDAAGTAHYALVKAVVVVARPFVGPGPRVDGRLVALLERWYTPKFPGGGR